MLSRGMVLGKEIILRHIPSPANWERWIPASTVSTFVDVGAASQKVNSKWSLPSSLFLFGLFHETTIDHDYIAWI